MSHPISSRLFGIIPPVTTPFADDGKFDRRSAESLYAHMLEVGVNGLFLFGSSGEGPMLAEAARYAAVETAVAVAGSKVPVLTGVLAPGTEQAIDQAVAAQELGADGLVVCPPFYFPATQENVLAHFRAIRKAVDLPILIYDIPRTTQVKIAMETVLALAGEGTAVALKDSSGDMVSFRRLLARCPADFRAFTGSELMVDAALLMGAAGSVPGLANVAPELFVELYEHWTAGRHAEATATQKRLVRLFDVFVAPDGSISSGYAIGAMKTAQKLRGWIDCHRLSAPFPQPGAELESRTKSVLIETGLL